MIRVKLSREGQFLAGPACAGMASTGTVLQEDRGSVFRRYAYPGMRPTDYYLVLRDGSAGARWYAARYWERL